jgi:DNA-binding NarL/FixJ family response regulator
LRENGGAAGTRRFPRSAVQVRVMSAQIPAPKLQLTSLEMTVMQCIADGITREEIAKRIGLHPSNVAPMVQAILDKIEAASAK